MVTSMIAAEDRIRCARERKLIRCPSALFALILLAGIATATAQDPPPDSETVLRASRERLLADVERMPRYTCVQTIDRRYYLVREDQPSCNKVMAEYGSHHGKPRLLGWDRLRLEVADVNNETVYSWVGAPRFESGQLEQLAGRGPLNTGDFSSFIFLVFNQAAITFKSEDSTSGQRLLSYSYDVSQSKSSYRIKTNQGWVPVAYSGTFTLDPATHDIVSLSVKTAEQPAGSPDCQSISEIQYGRTQIHESMVLIPRATTLISLDRQGGEIDSLTTYARCREYASKTRMLFDGSAPSQSRSSPLPGATALPPGLEFRARIVSTIDSDSSAAGDPVEAVLRSPLRDKDKKVLAPEGARLHGRLMALEQSSHPQEYFRVVIEFESIEINGKPVPLHAVSQQLVSVRGHAVFRPRVSESLNQRPLPEKQEFLFFVHHLHLEKFEWTWITLPYSEQDKQEKESGSQDR
jgi:hypothetical protein